MSLFSEEGIQVRGDEIKMDVQLWHSERWLYVAGRTSDKTDDDGMIGLLVYRVSGQGYAEQQSEGTWKMWVYADQIYRVRKK